MNLVAFTDGMCCIFVEFGLTLPSVPGAGIAIDKPFVDHSWQEAKRLMDINLAGTYFSAQLATKQMIAQGTGGSIVLVASVASYIYVPGHNLSAYSATKGAVRMLGKALAVELAPHGIRTNSISPGYIESAMTRELRVQYPHLVDIMQNTPPMRRIGNRNDLTGAVVYLLSDASSYTTGTDIQITGGLHAGSSRPE